MVTNFERGLRLQVKDLETLKEFEDHVKDYDGIECNKEFGGVKCKWSAKTCSEIDKDHLGNITFLNKYSQEIHIPVRNLMVETEDGGCKLMINVNASQSYRESGPKNRLYIGYALF